jgi:hypothetical protein
MEKLEAIGIWDRTQPCDRVGSAAIDDYKCAAAPFDVMLREPSGNLGKRKIGFDHIDTVPIAPRMGESS